MPAANQTTKRNEPIPGYRYPDGGWGWVVVAATGLSNFITIPVMQSFALIYNRRIEQLNMTKADLSTVMIINGAFGMGLGLIAGPLLKQFGYRKVALAGSLCAFVGITCTGWANSFITLLLVYSIVTSTGTFLLMSAFSLAINTYFCDKRGYAAGLSTGVTGLGPVCMPLVIAVLLDNWGTQGAMMILGALAAHSIAAAQLLHPIKWHLVKIEKTDAEEQEDILKQDSKDDKAEAENPRRRKRTITTNSADLERDIDTQSFYGGCETPLVSHRSFGSTMQISAKRKTSAGSFQRSISQYEDGPNPELSKRISHISKDRPWWKSEDTINLGSSVKIFDEKSSQPAKKIVEINLSEEKSLKIKDEGLDVRNGSLENFKNNNEETKKNDELVNSGEEKETLLRRCGRSIVAIFDLDLLTDSGYVILMLGMSLAICAELNFSLSTPIILGGYGFPDGQVAIFMSVVGFTDIIFRFLAPFVGNYLKYSAQTMYLISLLMLITARSSLMIFHKYPESLSVACVLGIAKGFRTVYMGLVIPCYVPLHRLPSANGIQNLVNCIFLVISIPLMAALQETSTWCIVVVNCITLSTVCLWTVQLIYNKMKRKREAEEESEDQA